MPVPDGRQLITMTESVLGTYRVDTATLKTLGRLTFADRVKGDLTTAHPTMQPNGKLINLTSGVCPADHRDNSLA